MKKRVIVFGILAVLLLFFYTTAFTEEAINKNYIDFPEVDYSKGEKFIYGSILKVDYDKREIEIEQHMDDNSIKANPILKVRNDIVIILQRNDKFMNIHFEDIKIGDVFGLILDSHGMVRGVIISV